MKIKILRSTPLVPFLLSFADIKKRHLSPLISVIGLALTSSLFAQPDSRSTITDAQKKEAFIRFTTVDAESRVSADDPSSDLYKYVIGELLLNPSLRERMPPADLKLLENLPGHTDESYVSKDLAEIGRLCKLSKDGRGIDVTDLALQFEESKSKSEDRLINSYEAAIAKLSVETQNLVESLLHDANRRIQITSTNVDLHAMAIELPDVAGDIIAMSCERFNSDGIGVELRSIRLVDELSDETKIHRLSGAVGTN